MCIAAKLYYNQGQRRKQRLRRLQSALHAPRLDDTEAPDFGQTRAPTPLVRQSRKVYSFNMQPSSILTPPGRQLWQQLLVELLPILDQHHVCAVAAQTAARQSRCWALVLLKSQNKPFYDAWVSDPDGELNQIRLPATPALNALVEGGLACRLAREAAPVELRRPLPAIQIELLFGAFNGPALDNGSVPGGALIIADPVESILSETEIAGVAGLVTLFLERALMRYDALRKTIVTQMAQEISDELTSTLSHEDIIETISNPVRRVLNVDSVSIGLVESETGDLVFVAALLGPLFKELPPLRLKSGEGIAGWVAQQGEPVISNNVYADTRFFTRADLQSGFVTRSILCVPLWVENQVIGVLEAINKKNDDFDSYDLDLLTSIAGPLAIALENAKLHTQVLAEKRRMEALFANMSEGIVTTDPDGLITAANDSFLTLLRATAGDIIGRSVTRVIQTKPKPAFANMVNAILKGDSHLSNITCDLHTHDAQAVPVLISGARILQEQEQLAEIIFVFSDLREIREVERMRDDFFHNVIHELRTPLATILMYTRLLRSNRAQEDEAKRARFLSVIEQESDHLQSMVRQMLAAATMEAREIQRSATRVHLSQLLDEMMGPLAEQAQTKGLHFQIKIPPDLPPLLGDREILYSVFKNLLENAIKFTPKGEVSLEAWQEEQTVWVEVRDQGIGIPQAALPNLFKRFYRTQTAVEKGIAGTGLGLYMVKEGVEKHGGTLEVISAEGVGTTFVVRLPSAPPAAGEARLA